MNPAAPGGGGLLPSNLIRRYRRDTTHRHRYDSLKAADVLEIEELTEELEEAEDEWKYYTDVLAAVGAGGGNGGALAQATTAMLLDVDADMKDINANLDEIVFSSVPRPPLLRFEFDLWGKDCSWLCLHTKFCSFDDYRTFLDGIGLGGAGAYFVDSSRHRFPCAVAVVATLSTLVRGTQFIGMEEIFGDDARVLGSMYTVTMEFVFSRFARKLSEPDTMMRYGERQEEFITKIREKCRRPSGRVPGYDFNEADFRVSCFADAWNREILRVGSGPAHGGPGAPRKPDSDLVQEAFYSGYLGYPGVKGLLVNFPNGMIGMFYGLESARRNDRYLVNRCGLNLQLERLRDRFTPGRALKAYGDGIFVTTQTLAGPFNARKKYSDAYRAANPGIVTDLNRQDRILSAMRICAEWMFAIPQNSFRAIDDYTRFKLLSNNTHAIQFKQLHVALFMSDVLTTFYGNQVSNYFKCKPPLFHDYIRDLNQMP